MASVPVPASASPGRAPESASGVLVEDVPSPAAADCHGVLPADVPATNTTAPAMSTDTTPAAPKASATGPGCRADCFRTACRPSGSVPGRGSQWALALSRCGVGTADSRPRRAGSAPKNPVSWDPVSRKPGARKAPVTRDVLPVRGAGLTWRRGSGQTCSAVVVEVVPEREIAVAALFAEDVARPAGASRSSPPSRPQPPLPFAGQGAMCITRNGPVGKGQLSQGEVPSSRSARWSEAGSSQPTVGRGSGQGCQRPASRA